MSTSTSDIRRSSLAALQAGDLPTAIIHLREYAQREGCGVQGVDGTDLQRIRRLLAQTLRKMGGEHTHEAITEYVVRRSIRSMR